LSESIIKKAFSKVEVRGCLKIEGKGVLKILEHLHWKIEVVCDIVSNGSELFFRDGRYFTDISKELFVKHFIALFKRMRASTGLSKVWKNKYGDDAWIYFVSSHYEIELDNYPNYIAFNNGVYDISAKEFLELDRVLITRWLPYKYVEFPLCPQFEKAVCEIFPDKEDRDWFLTYMNYSFGSSILQKIALILTGKTNNGKSSIIGFFQSLMGRKACSISLSNLHKDVYGYLLKNRTSCYSAEAGGDFLSQKQMDKIKYIITEDTIGGKKLYKNPDEWINTIKLILSANGLPRLKTFERAFLRRFKIIVCPSDFSGSEDRDLFKRLLVEEGGDILSWILQNYSDHSILVVDWLETKDQWKHHSDEVLKFIDTKCKITDKVGTDHLDVHNSYKAFCEQLDITPKERKYFSKKMAGYNHPTIELSQSRRYYEGIELL